MIINDCIPVQEITDAFYQIIDRNYVGGEYKNISFIKPYCFYSNTSLQSVSFPNCISIGNHAFFNCTGLVSTNFQNCKYIGSYAFNSCKSLSLISFPKCESIEIYAFYGCTLLSEIWIGGSSIVSFSTSLIFLNSPIGRKQGTIHVPSSLYSQYLVAPHWSYFSSCFTSNGWN